MSATLLWCPVADLGLDLLLDSRSQADPNDRPWWMLIRDRPLQLERPLDNPGECLSIVAQNRFVRAHPGLLRILSELCGCDRPNAIDEIAHANDGPRPAGDQRNLTSDRGARSTNFPGLPAVQDHIDPRVAN